MDYLVSIIVPVFNVEKYLERCVNSILVQEYQNIEIILVDDGSTDNSGAICDELAQKSDKIITVHKKNGGLSDARNYGIERAKGEYFCFIDSDDCIHPQFVKTLMNMICSHCVKIASIGYVSFDSFVPQEELEQVEDEVFGKEEAISYLFNNEKYSNFAWNKIYHKSLFENIRYPFGRKMEDLGTTYRLFDECEKIVYRDEKLYYYFQREDSILHKTNKAFFIDKYQLAVERYLYIKMRYPNMKENYKYMLEIIFECYKYIYDDSTMKSQARKNMKELLPNIYVSISIRKQIKAIIFLLNTSLFRKLFI